MLANSLSITIGGTEFTLKRKNQDSHGSVFMDNTTVAGTEVKLALRNSYDGKPKVVPTSTGQAQSQYERHVVDLTYTTTDAYGFRTVIQTYVHMRNRVGSSVGGVAAVASAICGWTNTNSADLIAWEV